MWPFKKRSPAPPASLTGSRPKRVVTVWINVEALSAIVGKDMSDLPEYRDVVLDDLLAQRC